jgi:hypothetical protein
MSVNYNLEKEFLKKVENSSDQSNKREIATEEQLKILVEKHPQIPQDYIVYLNEIGAGNLRECFFKVHSFLFDLEDIGLEEHYDLKPNVWFFGDNFSGDFSGFDFEKNDGHVVEFWHETGELYYTNKTFQDYIREQMLMNKTDTQ